MDYFQLHVFSSSSCCSVRAHPCHQNENRLKHMQTVDGDVKKETKMCCSLHHHRRGCPPTWAALSRSALSRSKCSCDKIMRLLSKNNWNRLFACVTRATSTRALRVSQSPRPLGMAARSAMRCRHTQHQHDPPELCSLSSVSLHPFFLRSHETLKQEK